VAAERRAARLKKEEGASAEPDKPPDGVIQFTHTDQGSLMSITGSYADRLQTAAYAMIKGLSDVIERLAESGAVGDFSIGPVKGSIPDPRQRKIPRRLRETTGHGELK
jgi:hypothetical protein